MPGIPKFTSNPKREDHPPFPPVNIGKKPDSMSFLNPLIITHAVKLPSAATTVPASLVQPQVISAQLGLLSNALKSDQPVSELADILKLANPAAPGAPLEDVEAISNKGLLSGLLNPGGLLSTLTKPTAISEKLAAVTNVLKTGSPLDDAAKLLGAGALPVPASQAISTALSTITGALSTNNLISGSETGDSGSLPSLIPNAVSGALSTVTNALKSGNLIPDPLKGSLGGLVNVPPLPILSDIIPGVGDNKGLANLSPELLSEAVGTVTNALKSGDLIPTDHKGPEGLPLPLPDQVTDALSAITSALHKNELLADVTKLPATILPIPLAQTVSETLETITTALASGLSSADAKNLFSASGLPNPLTNVISETLDTVSALPSELADTVKSALGTISDTLRSSDQLLDAVGLPQSALLAPVTSTVADTLDTVASLPPPVADAISGILDSVADAVRSGDINNTGPWATKPPKSVTFEVPDADNSTNANPVPDGHKGKRIIICCDGTWQDSDAGDAGFPTNVTRFARALKSVSDSGVAQIIYYQSGVGSAYASKLGRLIAGGTGLGLSEHVREAFVFISNNYHVGDEIHIVGFSRGAFTARSIAGLMGRIGVLTRRGMENFGKIYEDYINFKLRDDAWIDKQGWERIKGVSIKTIGCWDTVGALGIPTSPVIEKCKCNDKYKFHDTDLTAFTENAFHALALDEHRMPFTPTLWRLPNLTERHTDIVPNLKQVWFPGVHTNIGGGYKDQELSDLTLVWMIEQFIPFLGFDLNYVKSLREVSSSSDWASGAIPNSFVGVMKVTTSKVRTPGGYFGDPPKSPLKRAMTFGAGVFGQRGVRSVTNEEIHPSVRGRMVASNGEWCSRALFGWSCDKKIVQTATGPAEKWVWTNPNNGTELLESDMGEHEKVLAGTEVVAKLASLVTVPLRKSKGAGMDKVPVDSKWAERIK
ncbi:hypothetical protein TWF225_008270 [Orbilia oligospora]|nr:hypothetical protein TWF225_008270 [Orbilia oligospora]KAF3254695.1 hypothetical protein TWF128_006027 [Orbilia oligospora]